MKRKSFKDRLLYRSMYRCSTCRAKETVPHSWRFLVSRYARCPQCGTTDLNRRKKRDGIDRMYRNPISLVQALWSAPLYHCLICRLQFYDSRPAFEPAPPAPPKPV